MANKESEQVKGNTLSNLISKIKANKYLQYAIIVLLLLACVFILFKNEKTQSTTKVLTENDYVLSLENKLENVLSQVEGAGKVSVIINVESGMQTILATEKVTTQNENGTETIEKPIIVNGKTVVIKEAYPKIKGVLIVAEGGNNISVLSKIQQATTSLLDINLEQIEILTMK